MSIRCGGVEQRTVVALLAMIGALALSPAALGSSLSGSVALDPPSSVDLTSAGALDWAVWGSAGGGTSTSLAPDVRKSGGTAISDLTNIDPAPTAPLRGIGQFAGPFLFNWSNGGSTASGSDVPAGLQHNGGPPPPPLGADVSTLGKGFSFDVPAGTQLRTLRVYVATNRADGQLTATLSDGSAPAFVDTLPAATDIRSGIYTITYAAASSGQSLHVSWVETADNCAAFRCDNAAIYAVALSTAIVVNTSTDHDDGVCSAADCTLREAINAANAGGGGTIAFAIPGGPATITPTLAPLPTITTPVEIDGTTESAPPGTLGITIDGSATSGNGLVLGPGSGGSTIRGLAINGHQQFEGPPFAGILVQSDGNTIAQNYIGTTADGLEGDSNDQGIVVTGSGNLIGGAGAGNLVSGNGSYGILVDGSAGAHDNVVAANLVGTDSSGNVALSNEIGIATINGALHTLIGGNTAADGNVVFGAETGIDVHGIAGVPDNSEIRFNSVGVGKDGTSTLGSSFAWALGVNSADGAIVADNVVGNGESGLALANSNDLIVVRNFVGVDRTGGSQGNLDEGIDVQLANSTIRPQNVLLDSNTVRFNGLEGILLSHADRATVTGNDIADNGTGIGVDGDHNTIGPGNTVRNNTITILTGVAVTGGIGNTITQNSIDGNGGLGVDLSDDNVTANDPGDGDTGPNGLQNFPTVASASADGTSVDVAYGLDSVPNAGYTIEFFSSPSCDQTNQGVNYGEGATYLGSRQVKLGGGPGNFAATLTGPAAAAVAAGQVITATATDSNGSTSEFSACATVTAANVLANLSLTADEPSVPAGAANVPLASVPPSLLGAFAFSPIPNSPIPNSGVGAAPIPNSPIPNSPIPNSPIPNSPIPNSPIANSGLDGIPTALLSSVLLSSIPVDWSAIFVAPDPHAGVPVTSLTLADLFADSAALTRFNSLKLGTLQLQNTLLRGARFTSFLFGATKLKWIPPNSQDNWCLELGKAPGCSDFDVNTTTVLGLDIAGLLDDAEIARLGQLTVGDITDPGPPVTPIPNSPIPNSPIPNSPIPNSPIPNSSLSLTAIGSILVGDLYNPDAVVDCTKFTSRAVCLAKTLAEASAAGAMKSTATFADLSFPKTGSTVSPLAGINFNAFSVGLIGLENLPWESWPFAGFQQFAGTGDVVHYHLTAPVPCGTPYTLRAVLPNGFIVKAGTSALAIGVGAAKAVPDPSQSTDGATWSSLPLATGCAASPGSRQTVRLDFQALAGFRLGEQSSIVRLIIGPSTSAATGQAPVTVTQNLEPDGDPATAPALAPNTLAIGHIATEGDLDWRSISTTGMAPGTKIQVFMRPPAGTDLDLYLTKPSAQTLLASPIPNSPIPNSPIPNSPLPDNGSALNTPTDNPQPEGLQDAPIPNSQIASSGITRGDGVEVAQVTLSGDENGPVKVLVDGYNGDHSNDPYTLRVKVITPPQLPACPARTYANPLGAVGTLPLTIPADTKTLFLFNYGATGSAYGQTAATALRDRLNAFVAAHPDLKAVLLPVDGDTAVRSAKAAWDASPCAPAAANDVVRKINAVVARYRAGAPNVENIVIVGGDELMPMARISDLTTDANESTAVSDLLFTTNGLTRGNALFASEFLSNTLTDDAYTAGTTIPWFGRELYLPQVAGGRLVETPAEITQQLDSYDTSNGILDPSTGVVAGYDFMRDEATQVKSDLGSRHTVGGTSLAIDASNPLLTTGAPFISPLDSWGQADVQPYFASSTLAPGILSVNGHYNQWELAPATTPITNATLVPTSVLPASGRLSHAILFTMGCHAGLNVSDLFPSTPSTAARLRDWAQALAQNGAGVYVANTGYGYGDYDTIALSERLMTMFAHNLASDGSIGRKLVFAKQQYFASIASYDPYAEKALAEATFYGLPFYRIGAGPEPAGPAPLTPTPTSVPNVAAAALSFSFTGANALVPHSTARGKYWSAADGGVEYLKDRPIEPRVSQEVTAVGTQRAHGVVINGLQTHDVAGNVNPLIATPMIDLAAHEPESKVTDATFPATFASLNHWNAFGQNHDQLVLVPGQTREGTTQRLVDSIDLQVLYSTSTDFTAPLFTQVGSVVNGDGTATLFARTSDASGIKVVKAYFTQGGSTWTFVTLTLQPGTTDLYAGTATGITVPKLESAFLAEDGAGNVGYTTDKGFLFISTTADGQGPQITIAAPIDHGVFYLGQPVPASYSCFDSGGVLSCTNPVANGQNIDTSSLGQKTFTVTATDLEGNHASATATYTVAYKFAGFFQPVDNLPTLNMLNAGQAVPVKFTLNGNQGLSIFAAGSPSSAPIACDATAPVDPVDQTVTNSNSGLSYDAAAGQYTYVWKTDKSWAGSCRQLTVALKDGTVHRANFKFK